MSRLSDVTEPPGQPRISDDGKFYWDGARWEPLKRTVNVERTTYQKIVFGLALALRVAVVAVTGVAASVFTVGAAGVVKVSTVP